MKAQPKFYLFITLAAALLSFPLQAQSDVDADSTGLAGDHFSLEAALDLFKQSSSLEDFEKRLNEEDNPANNLDLNEDGEIDYVRVVDQMDGDVHAIVLQVPVSGAESQDIAVIELEKTGAESAVLQIVGDEDIFGEQVIAEPSEDAAVDSPKGRGGPAVHLAPDAIIVNVWLWPSVRYMYRPAYVVYVSPWRWGLYPTWWRPFHPRPWRVYHARVRPYYAHYHVVTTHRVVRARAVYAPHRTHSTVVHTRTTTVVKNNGGRGRVSKTQTTTTTNGRNGRVAEKKQTTNTVEGRNGRSAEKQKTSTTVEGRNGRTLEREKTTTTAQGRDGRAAKKQKTSTTMEGKHAGKAQKQKTTTKAKAGAGGKRGRN